ncbi:MAG: DUF1223 domain-containing protein [Paracoccus sp. (in: a-proteobacteria)]|uniref:DUF1223 domain-containing protein n=1 Tax=Paracoccus sp. TaxID=267 RepID=UPI0039E26836
MASGCAINGIAGRRGFLALAFAFLLGGLAAPAVLAQEAGRDMVPVWGTGPAGGAGPAGGWPLSHMDPGDPDAPIPNEPVGVTVLDAPTDSGAVQNAQVGLIEAPEGAAAEDASGHADDPEMPLLADGALADGPGVANFAERRTAQTPARMFGPIGHPPVVVELFTSQGCSSCPPADEMLGDLADRDDVLALSWHVDYWDYLGWADDFARPEFTLRQQDYAHAWGERAIYTPQMVVGGTDTLIALRPAELMALMRMQMARPAPVLVSSRQAPDGSYQLELTPRTALRQPVAILLVRYAPERRVTIKAGENRGVSVSYRNVVLAVDRIGQWDGRAPLRMSVRANASTGDAFPEDTRHAILTQELGRGKTATGPILAAIRLD